jgi:hypothetical protein
LCEDDRVAPDCSLSLRPRRVICRSDTISRREELLACRGLVISVIADDPGSLSPSIGAVVARRFEIEEGLLTIRPLGPARLLLISPGQHTATRIYNDGRPIPIPPGRLHVMRWSRFLQLLPSLLLWRSSLGAFRRMPGTLTRRFSYLAIVASLVLFTQIMLLKVKSSGSLLSAPILAQHELDLDTLGVVWYLSVYGGSFLMCMGQCSFIIYFLIICYYIWSSCSRHGYSHHLLTKHNKIVIIE